jgi:pseudouridine-5'-phosphate glycosidase
MDKYINQALNLAKEKGIKGKQVTPFLLETLKDLTKGASLEANLALIYNNAVLGANISKELAKKGA